MGGVNSKSLNLVNASGGPSTASVSGNTGGTVSSGTGEVSTSTGGGGGSSQVSTGTASSTPLHSPPPQGSGAGGNVGNSTNSGNSSVSTPSVDLTNPAAATTTFAAFLNDSWMNDPNLNINALVQAVLRNSYQDNQQDLKDYALKVEFYNNLKKNIRAEIANARSFQSANATSNGNATFTNGSYQASPTGGDTYTGSAQVNKNVANNWGSSGVQEGNGGISSTGQINTPNDLNNYISTMEEYLTSVGDDAQLAQVDLQNMAQNQQQTLQTLSNLSKSFNDVSMAIIRNIQG